MRTILHLCADTGTDSFPYQQDPNYEVILIGSAIGVENYSPDRPIHGIIANPVCTEFSSLNAFNSKQDTGKADLSILEHCQRIIKEANPNWWVIENPARGSMRNYLGKPTFTYEPWHYGSPWTKPTALWGNFNPPPRTHDWDENEKLPLYTRPKRNKPSLAFLHKSAYHLIPEFAELPAPQSDSEFRSYCSQRFAREFKKYNP